MRGCVRTLAPARRTAAHRVIRAESANLQSTFDYPREGTGGVGISGKTSGGVSECKPTGELGIYLSILADGRIQPGGPWNRLAGAWDFRDFSCLPPAEENRAQPADPAPTEHTNSNVNSEVFMSTDAGRQSEMRLALNELISILLDSQKGFADIGEHLKDETLKKYFLAESLKRASFRGDLEEILHQNGVHDIKESGTTAGAIHRAWGDLKAKLGGGDHSLLETAEQGEDEAKKAYADVLDQDLPLPVRQLIAEQQAHVLTAHDFVRSHRDALVSK
jgi:uncharacterized protein (TIGR02284 family)